MVSLKKPKCPIWWTAHNSSRFLRGHRRAESMRQAVKDARQYLDNELCGDGVIAYFDFDPDNADPFGSFTPVRIDEKTIHTSYKWAVQQEHPKHAFARAVMELAASQSA
jgi:hypothetical protein